RAVELRISAACIARVRAAAKALGYRGNYHASTLATGRSYTIGLTTGAGGPGILAVDYWGAILGGIGHAARQGGYDVLLAGGSSCEDALDHAMQLLETGRIDALVAPRQLFRTLPATLFASRRPVVTIGGHDVGSPHDVRLDPGPGIAEAVAHLAALGHRSVLWIGFGRGGKATLPERRAAFRVAARAHGLTGRDLLIAEPESLRNQIDEGLAAIRAALASATWPAGVTAVCCFNDMIAVAVLELLRDRGVRVPRDLSVIGFDDLLGAAASPPLTTVSHCLAEIGTTAVQVVLEALAGGKPPAVSLVPSRLVVRASTGAPGTGV
ncbi:MAG: LacI family DNA-binding transcriptional regulator, partial [Planctomycetes bacterium]|nr:LacI family DNA-binding transcriptional regulator [Planctomycetota bacterium]